MKSNIIPEALDDLVPEIQVPTEAVLVPNTEEPAVPVELDLGAAENMSVPSQELSVNPEPEELVSIAVETEPEPLSTNSTSEDKISTLEVEEQHVLLSSGSPDAETLEFQAQHSVEGTAEVSFTFIPAAGSFTDCNKFIKEVHAIVEAPSEPVIVPNEGEFEFGLAIEVLSTDSQLELTATAISNTSSFDDFSALAVEPEQEKASLEGSTNVAISLEPFYEPHSTPKNGIVEEEISAEPVKAQLEALTTPETEEGNRTAEVDPQIILPIMEASPAQIEEDRLVPAAQVRQVLSSFYLLTVKL